MAHLRRGSDVSPEGGREGIPQLRGSSRMVVSKKKGLDQRERKQLWRNRGNFTTATPCKKRGAAPHLAKKEGEKNMPSV